MSGKITGVSYYCKKEKKTAVTIYSIQHCNQVLQDGSITFPLSKTMTKSIYSPNPLSRTMFTCLLLLTEL